MVKFTIEILLLLFGFLAVIVGVFGDTFKDNKITTNGKRALLTGFLVLFLSIIQKMNEYKNEQAERIENLRTGDSSRNAQNIRYRSQIEKLEKITNNLKSQSVKQDSLNEKSNEIATVQNKLNDKYGNLITVNKEIINNQIGGNSFCLVWPIPLEDYKVGLQLQHRGNYNLYDLVGKLIDDGGNGAINKQNSFKLDKILPMKTADSVFIMPDKNIFTGVLPKNQNQLLKETISFDRKTRFDYKFSFSGRNGEWIEIMKMRMVRIPNTNQGNRLFAIQVFKIDRTKNNNKGKILYTMVADGYPKNKKGEVDWDKNY